MSGRLDQQRYSYVRWAPPPSYDDDARARVELARRYFEWTGPATLAQFRWFTAFSAAHAKAALADLDLVNGLRREDLQEFEAYSPPRKPHYNLLAGIDGLFLLRRDLAPLVDGEVALPGEKQTVGGGLSDLPDHAIVDRGRLVGLWQYDPEQGEIVAWLLDGSRPDPALRAEIERTTAFVRDQLGDARAFSLDSPKSRAPRLAALRQTRMPGS